jgi:hypothetical protein
MHAQSLQRICSPWNSANDSFSLTCHKMTQEFLLDIGGAPRADRDARNEWSTNQKHGVVGGWPTGNGGRLSEGQDNDHHSLN